MTIRPFAIAALAAVGCVLSVRSETDQGWQGFATDREVVTRAAVTNPPPANAPYRNPDLGVDERIADLLPRLTPQEKVHLLHATGGLTMGNIPRIGLSVFRTPDAGQGPRAEKRPGITYFPAPIAFAAAFDHTLVRDIGRVMGEETRAVYPAGLDGNGVGRMLLGPGANIARVPVGARNFEYFGEDPRLSGETAADWISGLQSVRVAPCMKHYCFNEQEYSRQLVDVDCPERAVREIYTRPWEIAVRKADPWAVMNSYNKFRGRWTSHSAYLNDLLAEAGFSGAIVPDWGGYHGAVGAINGGTTIESGTDEDAVRDAENLKQLAEGKIDRTRFDEAVRRALRLYFRVGAFDADSAADKALQAKCEAAFHSAEHQSVARRAAEESFVLVKNEGGFLPFARPNARVAVVGPYANRRHAMSEGDVRLVIYGGAAAVKAAREITPLEGFRNVFGAANVVTGDDSVATAAKADLVIYCGGIDHTFDCEAGGANHVEPNDRRDIYLEAEDGRVQEDEIRAIAAVNPNLVVALNGGAPVSVEEWHDKAKAIFVTWYGGEFGGEVLARMITGDVNPSGRLPYTYGKQLRDWPAVRYGVKSYPGEWAFVEEGRQNWRREEPKQYYYDGIWVGYRGFERFGIEPRYPFGHGLAYTDFEVRNLAVGAVDPSGRRRVTCTVANVGNRAGRHAVLLWAAKPPMPGVEMPARELVAYESVMLEPGADAKISFNIGFEELKYWDDAANGWKMPVGDVRFAAD